MISVFGRETSQGWVVQARTTKACRKQDHESCCEINDWKVCIAKLLAPYSWSIPIMGGQIPAKSQSHFVST